MKSNCFQFCLDNLIYLNFEILEISFNNFLFVPVFLPLFFNIKIFFTWILQYCLIRLMWSGLLFSAGYCDQIAYDPFAQHYNRLLHKNPGFVIIQLMLSVSLSLKVIRLTS